MELLDPKSKICNCNKNMKFVKRIFVEANKCLSKYRVFHYVLNKLPMSFIQSWRLRTIKLKDY